MITAIQKSLAKKRDAIEKDEQGFTLIELLVVVIIIGILAAIAIPIYIGVQNNAKNSATQSDLANAKIAVVAYQTNNNALPPAASLTVATLGTYGFTLSSNTTSIAYSPSFPGASSTTFCLAGVSTGGSTYYVTDSLGVTSTKPSGC